MSHLNLALLAAAALLAGIVNGLLGHGFSSLMVPTGLLMAPARLLNPALVLIELPLNGSAAWIHRRRAKGLLGELIPFALALLPGVAIGALLLRFLPESILKALCYGLLLLMVCSQFLTQAFGKPSIAPPPGTASKAGFGFGTGLLYGLTTISGPTLAAYAQRRGYAKDEARAALAWLRALEGALSLVFLFLLGLFTWPGLRLAGILLPLALVGLFIGHRLAARVDERRFRRLALGFNLLAVLAGLARAVSHLSWAPAIIAPALWTGAAITTLWLLFDWAPAALRKAEETA